jgi:hypothetical protein
MRITDCHESFHQGQVLRLQHPLRNGHYKLVECQNRLQSCLDEVGRIRAFVRKEASKWSLRHCTADDKHIWLKDLPSNVAHRLSYEVLPGLRALVGDGADQREIDIAYPHFEKAAHVLVNRLESVRVSISKCIVVEYWHMKQGGSLLEPVVDEAISLTQRALAIP